MLDVDCVLLHDAHNHLQDDWLAPHLDRIARAFTALGPGTCVVNGTCEADWERVSALSRQYAWVRPSYGLHPWDAGNRSAGWRAALEKRLAAEPHAAVGEIGIDRWILDRARPDDPRLTGLRRASLEEQTEVFLAQLELAARDNRPVTIHCLDVWGQLADLLRDAPLPERGFLLHAYGGSRELAVEFAKRGAYFSFNGAFLDPRKQARRAVFAALPAERLLVETDAPAMAPPVAWRTHKLPPAPDGSTINHPANIEAAYAGLAALRGVSPPELSEQVDANFKRLFG
jgi:TatD DNase family protein